MKNGQCEFLLLLSQLNRAHVSFVLHDFQEYKIPFKDMTNMTVRVPSLKMKITSWAFEKDVV